MLYTDERPFTDVSVTSLRSDLASLGPRFARRRRHLTSAALSNVRTSARPYGRTNVQTTNRTTKRTTERPYIPTYVRTYVRMYIRTYVRTYMRKIEKYTKWALKLPALQSICPKGWKTQGTKSNSTIFNFWANRVPHKVGRICQEVKTIFPQILQIIKKCRKRRYGP